MPEDRDQLFEKALARQLRSDAADSQCLDAETLAAFYERMLSPEELTDVKTHVASCARCQEVLAQLAATQEVSQSVEDPSLVRASAGASTRGVAEAASSQKLLQLPARKPSQVLRWAAPAGAVAAGLLLLFGVDAFRKAPRSMKQQTEVAQNRPEPATAGEPAQAMKEATQAPASSAENKERQNQIEQELRDLRTPALSAPDSSVARADKKDLDSEKNAAATPARELHQSAASARAKRAVGPSAAAAQAQAADAIQDLQASRSGTVGAITQQVEVNPVAPKMETDQARISAPAAATPAPAAPPPPAPAPQSARQYGGAGASAQNQIAGVSETAKSGVFKSALSKIGSDVRIATPDPKKFWSVGPGGTIAFSRDGGSTWVAQNSGVTAALTGGSAPSDKVCWIAGVAGTLLRTTDAGKRWTLVQTPVAGDLGEVHATDAQHASIRDATTRLAYRTSDGGATWSQTQDE